MTDIDLATEPSPLDVPLPLASDDDESNSGKSDTKSETANGTASLAKILKMLKLQKSDHPTPLKPIMGGLVPGYRTFEAWTGGAPNCSWTDLVTKSEIPLPTQLRPMGSKAADSLIKRTAGIFTDPKSKFSSKGDLDYFCRNLHEFYIMHGMDTVSYRKDPLDKGGPMI